MTEMVAGEAMTTASMMVMTMIEMMKAVMSAAGPARGSAGLCQDQTEKDNRRGGEELFQ